MQPGTDFAKMDEKSPNLEMSNKDRRQSVFDHLKQFWTRQDAHRWGEEYDLNNSPQEYDLDRGFYENNANNLVVKYKYAINIYLEEIRITVLAAQPRDAEGRHTTPLQGRVPPERDQIQAVLNYWTANNDNDPAQFRDIAEYDEFLALNEKRKRYHEEWEKWGGKRGIHFAKSLHDKYLDFRKGKNRPWKGRGKSLTGSGLMNWLKNKYNNTFAKPTPMKTNDIVQPANQSLPPEIPSTNILQQVASNAYKESPAPVASFNLLHQTPTVKFYQSSLNAQLYVFGIRGTVVSDKQDRSADLSFNEGIVGNNLKRSARYQKDKADVADFLTRYNVDDSDFIVGAAHSLGGALCDELLHDGLIDYAVSFNPAVQPKDVNFTQFHRRIYLDKDPLYQTMARNNVKNNIEVRQTKQTTGSNILRAVNKNLGTLWQTKGAHSIDNFVGGCRDCKGQKMNERYYDEDANVWKGGSCMCPRNYQPVVGEDGKTYNNKCQAMCAKQKFDEAENRWVGGTQYFSIDNPETNELMYAAELQPQQCKFKINNRRCKRKQNIGVEYCFQHLPAFMKLKIQPTNDGRGKGVFAYGGKLANEATVVFNNKTIIAKYNGVKIDQEELNKRYGRFTGPYATEAERRRNPKKFIDAATIRGVGSMINANNDDDDDEEPNCALKFVENLQAPRVKAWNEVNPQDTLEKENDVIIVATKNIQHGAQLLLRYGDEYEFENNHTTGTKKPKETHGKNIKNGYYQELEDE